MTNVPLTEQQSPEIFLVVENHNARKQIEEDIYSHVSFMETDYPSMAQEAWRIHAEGYFDMGFVHEEAFEADGSLASDIDKARGDNVEYLLALNSDNETDSACMRKIHLPEEASFKDLPAFAACKDNMSPEGVDLLQSIEDEGISIKEISALAKTKDASPRAIFEIFRQAIQGAMGKDEVFFFSMVSDTHEVLASRLGRENFLTLGSDKPIEDPRVSQNVKLRPLLTRPDEFNENIYAAYMSATTPQAKRRFAQSLVFYTDGLQREQMSDRVFVARDKLVTEREQ